MRSVNNNPLEVMSAVQCGYSSQFSVLSSQLCECLGSPRSNCAWSLETGEREPDWVVAVFRSPSSDPAPANTLPAAAQLSYGERRGEKI